MCKQIHVSGKTCVYSCVNVQDQVIKVIIKILKERTNRENVSHTCKAHEQWLKQI